MLTINLTLQLPSLYFNSARLTLPPQITFYELHAALELILNTGCGNCYSFMLMATHRAIEDNTAAGCKAAPVFKQNPRIRYLNPYPGTLACLLELESIDNKESARHPFVSGTENDSQINTRLEEYCYFAEGWQYHNEDFFRKQYKAENKKQINMLNSYPETAEPQCIAGLRSKTIEQKQRIWDSTCLIHKFDETIRVTIGNSRYSQSGLLEASKKENLVNYCRYSMLSISANWRKKELAEAFTSNLRENMWLTMVLLPKEAIDLYLRLCCLKENQKCSLNLEKDAEALKLLIYLGMTDLLFGAGETDIRLELPTDFKKYFQVFFQNSKNFAPRSECTCYLSPEQKTGSWQKIVKGYTKLDDRTTMLLYCYGILTVEDLWEKLCSCYGYHFEKTEFKRYLLLHLRLLEIVYTGQFLGTRQRLVSPRELNIAYALKVQEKPIAPERQKPLKKEELNTYEVWLMEQVADLLHLLSNYVEDEYMMADISGQLIYCILQNETWKDYLDFLAELLEDIDSPMHMGFWYELSKLYLHLPVAGLGGYSRMEYAEKEQLPNPYLILNDQKNSLSNWECIGIFGKPFEEQYELYLSAERFIKDGTELSEKRMLKAAKKHLCSELATALQIHCYLISGSPKLLTLLEKEAKRSPESLEMLNQLKYMLNVDD